IMNVSSVANTSPSVKSIEDQGLKGHEEKENPFAEYMWMENEEDFNRQVEEELQEQDFLDRCFQEMLDEEDQDWFIPSRDLPQAMGQLQQQLNGLSVSDGHDSEDILGQRTPEEPPVECVRLAGWKVEEAAQNMGSAPGASSDKLGYKTHGSLP
ncbi:Polyadenylate-binding protein-interacting protein 2B, partial [Tupaia chinensis]